VPYRETRGLGEPALQDGKIHFLTPARLQYLPHGDQLLWSASFFDQLDAEGVEHYARLVSPLAEWAYFSDCVPGDGDDTERERAEAFPGHVLVDRRRSSAALAIQPPPGRIYTETFWARRRRL
jgi:hypothetical protein